MAADTCRDCGRSARWRGFWYDGAKALSADACDLHLTDVMPRDRTVHLVGLPSAVDQLSDQLAPLLEESDEMGDKLGKMLRAAPCSVCKGDDPECPKNCESPKLRIVGLTYVAVGVSGGGVVLGTDNDVLTEECGECGPLVLDVGLDEPPDTGIWRAIVRFWSNRDYLGEYDSGYTVEGEWETVESYPEPPCVSASETDPCEGLPRERDDEGAWACDKHAGWVA